MNSNCKFQLGQSVSIYRNGDVLSGVIVSTGISYGTTSEAQMWGGQIVVIPRNNGNNVVYYNVEIFSPLRMTFEIEEEFVFATQGEALAFREKTLAKYQVGEFVYFRHYVHKDGMPGVEVNFGEIKNISFNNGKVHCYVIAVLDGGQVLNRWNIVENSIIKPKFKTGDKVSYCYASLPVTGMIQDSFWENGLIYYYIEHNFAAIEESKLALFVEPKKPAAKFQMGDKVWFPYNNGHSHTVGTIIRIFSEADGVKYKIEAIGRPGLPYLIDEKDVFANKTFAQDSKIGKEAFAVTSFGKILKGKIIEVTDKMTSLKDGTATWVVASDRIYSSVKEALYRAYSCQPNLKEAPKIQGINWIKAEILPNRANKDCKVSEDLLVWLPYPYGRGQNKQIAHYHFIANSWATKGGVEINCYVSHYAYITPPEA